MQLHTGLFLSFVVLNTAGAVAQCVSTPALQGTTEDEDHAAVPAQLSVSGSNPFTTDSLGHFHLSCLPAFPFTVTVHANGFQDQALRFARASELKSPIIVALRPATVETTVSVTADDVVTIGGDTSEGLTLGREQVRELPDDPDEFQLQLRNLAALGGGPESVVINVDGFQASSALPPKSSIASIRINPDSFSPEYSRAPVPGGRVEILTKPGASSLHGYIFYAGSNGALNASNPFSTAAAPAGNQRFGVDVTGPIVRKKSGFSLSLEKRNIDEQSVTNAVTLAADGSAQPFLTTVTAPQRLWQGSARVEWQVAPSDSLVMSFNATTNDEQNQGTGGLVLPEAGYATRLREYSLRLSNNQIIGSTWLHQSRAGYTDRNQSETPNSGTPSLNVAGFFVGGGSIDGFLARRDQTLELDDQYEWTRGTHSVRFGALGIGDFIHDTNPSFFNGEYLFGGGDAVALSRGMTGTGGAAITALEQYRRALQQLPGGAPTSFQQATGTANVPLTQWQQAFYALEHFRLNGRVTVDAGLRYQFQSAPAAFRGVAPRLGTAIDLDGKGRWLLHAKAGIFPQVLDVEYAREVDRLNGIRQQETLIYSPVFGAPYTTGTGAVSVSTVDRFSNHIHQTTYFENELTLEHEFPGKWQALVLYDRGQEYGLVRVRNINAPLVGLTVNTANPLVALQAPRPIEHGVNIDNYEATGHEFGQLLMFSVAQRSAKRFNLTARYLFATGHGDTEEGTVTQSPQSSYSKQGEAARPTWQSKNRVQFIGSLQLPLRFQLASQLDAAGGRPYTVLTGTDNNEDGQFNDRPSFASAPGQGVYATRYGLLSPNVTNGSVPRNFGTMPAQVRMSVDLARTVPLHHASPDSLRSVAFNVRSSNVLNHTNVTVVNPIVGSRSFDCGVSAEPGRRIEFGARLNF